jgi:3-methyl-2-oxobutanoate hydroxymethyltransferase
VGSRITEAIRIPTIGIGAGAGTDGQVLVFHDVFGLTTGKAPRFVKRYANLADEISQAAQRFAQDVATEAFPGPENEYSANGAKPATSGDREEARYGAG